MDTPCTDEKSSLLSDPFPFTVFTNAGGSRKHDRHLTLAKLAHEIKQTTAATKTGLPLFSLCRYGTKRSDRGSLRHRGNIIAATGIECDYDRGEITPREAAKRLTKARVDALVYTTPSHKQPGKGNRWRIVAPFDQEQPLEKRAAFVARLNGLFDGELADESFSRSQAFYYGGTYDGTPVETYVVSGRRLDKCADLDAGAIGRGRRAVDDGDHDDDRRKYFEGNMARLKSAINAIDPDKINASDRYHPWLEGLMAIHHETDGDGIDIAHGWSKRWHEYEPDEVDNKWGGFGRTKGPKKTGAWLAETAIEQGWIDPVVHEWFDDLTKTAPLPEDDQPEAKGSLKFYSPADLAALPEVFDFVEDTLFEGQLSEWFGDPKVGKTFAILDLAMHVTLGREWHGRAVERGCAIYVALEGLAGIKRRIRAWCKYHDIDQNTIPILVAGGALNLRNSRRERAQLVEQAKLMAEKFGIPVRLVIVDTLHRSLGGGSDSKEEDMSALIAGVDALRAATGAHVLLIHHSGLADKDRGRGHSSLFGAIDTRVKVYDVPKREGLKALHVTAQKEGEGGAKFPFILRTVDLGYLSRRGKPVTSALATPELVPNELFDDLDAADVPDDRTKAAFAIREKLVDDKSDKAWRAALKAGDWPERGCTNDVFRAAWARLRKKTEEA